MPLPRKQFFALPEVSGRWGVSLNDLGCYALEDMLTLSTVVNGIDVEEGEYDEDGHGGAQRSPHGWRRLAGVQHLFGHDIWPAFKGGMASILRFKPDDPGEYIDIEKPAGGIEIGLADLVMTRRERDRFEAEHGLAGPESPGGHAADAPRPRGRAGALPKYDWDGFWIRICQMINDEGRTDSQAAMVRDLLEWFAGKSETVPDESTIKKKVSRFWREFEVR